MKNWQSLRFRIIAPALVISLIITGCVLAVFWMLTNGNFEKIEKAIALKNLQRISNAMDVYVKNMSVKSVDWAVWDDAYEYLKNKNKDFEVSNLDPQSVGNLNLNIISFIDSTGNIIHQSYVDFPSLEIATPPASLVNFINTFPFFRSNTDTKQHIEGIVSLSEGPLVVSIRPVVKSDGSGKFAGNIMFGRFINKGLLDDLAITVDQKFEIKTVKSQFANGSVIFSKTNNMIMDGKLAYLDINKENVFEIQAEFNRQLYFTGQQFLLSNISGVGIGILVFSLLVLQILSATAIKPITDLADQIGKIDTFKDFSIRIPTVSNLTEITRVANNINVMLEQLEQNKAALEDKVKLSQKQNTELEGSRKAMLNLLEDSRNLEKDLKQERDRAQTIISSMGEGLMVVDNEHRISLINNAAAIMLDTSQEEAVGKIWSDLVKAYENETEIPLIDRSFSQVIASNKPVITTAKDNHFFQTRLGRKFPVASITTPINSGDNKILGAIKVFRDVTPEKEATYIVERTVEQRTQELQWEKARLTTSINSLPDGFILIDPNERILVINHSASSILGLVAEVKNLNEIETQLKPYIDLHTAHEECKSKKTTLDIPIITIGQKFVRLFISPIFVTNDYTSSYVGAAFLITDITEQKVLERSKDEFFSIASHELRTPLTAIRGNTSMILDYYAEKVADPDLHSMVADIHESSVRLIGIVNDFLDVSRLEQSRMQFKKNPFDAFDLVLEVVKELQATTPPPPVPLNVFKAEESVPQVLADRDRTKQVVFNLIGNALKFTPTGKIDISITRKDPMIEIAVADSGRGIPEAQQKLLFHKFQQAGESLFTRDTSGGTGLGLYISKLLVEGMGGRIELVKSVPEQGSVFAFYLPLNP